jgi:hypothetical protein
MVARERHLNAVLDELAHWFEWSGIAAKAARGPRPASVRADQVVPA